MNKQYALLNSILGAFALAGRDKSFLKALRAARQRERRIVINAPKEETVSIKVRAA